jgi:hypothetical protein
MKKALYIICLFFVSVLFAEEFSYGDFLYKINENDEVILTKCKITNGFVQIPSEINGKKVTTIENDIFKYDNYISSIEIPDSVEKIYSGVFSTCQSLVSVTLSENNENFAIIDNILYNKKEKSVVSCFSTNANIVIPYGIERIGNKAFAYCDSLVSLTIPDTVVEIGDEAFVFCKAISVINIPNFINKIGAFAFNHCKSLKTLTMPNTVNVIGDGVFAGCSLLKNVDFSEDNENFVIIDNILYNKTERTVVSCFSDKKNIVIPAGIERICKKAFAYCDSIYSVSIPNSVKLIDDSAFFQCKSLVAVKIPYSVTKLGDEAFASCKLLSSIYVPDSVITIGNNVFNDYNLKFFVVHCGLESCAEQYCKKNNIKYSIVPNWLKK